MPPWSREKEKNEMIKFIIKRQVFFVELSFRTVFVLFYFRENVFFTSYVIHSYRKKFKWNFQSEAAVCRCSAKQVFLKISQCSQKTPAFEPLVNKAGALKACIFIKKEIPTQVFSCEYCDFFKNSFLWNTFCSLYFLCDDRILWTSLGTKLTCFIFLVLLLCFPSYRESIVISYLFLYQNF